jgi:tetratricopeptide (TPR) repeat protein
MKAKILILFLGCVIFANLAYCDELSQIRSLFYQGNASYGEEDFESAISYYESALDLGYKSAHLYYNLGNAYFKNGYLGKAILNYLRAKQLMPQDADLRSNLNYAQSRIKGGIVIPERKWLARIFFRLTDSFSLDQITMLSAILYFILAGLVICFIIVKNIRRILTYACAFIFFLLVFSLVIFYVQFRETVVQKKAVIMTQTSDSKFEPFDDATTFFTLYEGESVVVMTSRKNWVKIRRVDGKQGWIKKSDIEFL